MAVQLVMLVTRSGDNRLSGTVRRVEGRNARDFSGTLELMRAFEELVPISGEPGDAGRDPDQAGSAR